MARSLPREARAQRDVDDAARLEQALEPSRPTLRGHRAEIRPKEHLLAVRADVAHRPRVRGSRQARPGRHNRPYPSRKCRSCRSLTKRSWMPPITNIRSRSRGASIASSQSTIAMCGGGIDQDVVGVDVGVAQHEWSAAAGKAAAQLLSRPASPMIVCPVARQNSAISLADRIVEVPSLYGIASPRTAGAVWLEGSRASTRVNRAIRARRGPHAAARSVAHPLRVGHPHVRMPVAAERTDRRSPHTRRPSRIARRRSRERSDDARDTVLHEVVRHHERRLVRDAHADLDEVGGSLPRVGPVDPRLSVVPERQEGQLVIGSS